MSHIVLYCARFSLVILSIAKLPFCAIALLDSSNVYLVKDVTGDIHEKVIDEIKKQGINRAAVRIDGSFDKVLDLQLALFMLPVITFEKHI